MIRGSAARPQALQALKLLQKLQTLHAQLGSRSLRRQDVCILHGSLRKTGTAVHRSLTQLE